MRDRDCVAFLQWALPRMRMRWAGFRKVRRQVCRRVARRLRERDLPDLAAYRELLTTELAEWEVLDSLCRVTISRFFRDRGVFAGLQDTVLPELARRAAFEGRRAVRAWSAGCASGEEPYSLAILGAMAPAMTASGRTVEIVATDTDTHLLERARRAIYAAGSIREVPAKWRERAFTHGDGGWKLDPALAADVDLRCQDLRRSAPRGPFDLILCRNLAFTYYDKVGQREVLDRIRSVLRVGGGLVVGGHERPPEPLTGLEPWPDAQSCYRRR